MHKTWLQHFTSVVVNAGILSKDEEASSICRKLYEEMKSCPDEQFAQRISVLQQLYSAWLDCKLVLLTCLDIDDTAAFHSANECLPSPGLSANSSQCLISVTFRTLPFKEFLNFTDSAVFSDSRNTDKLYTEREYEALVIN
jgi:hypothetical protein